MSYQCTVPESKAFHLTHATVLHKTEITGFLNPGFSSAWDVG